MEQEPQEQSFESSEEDEVGELVNNRLEGKFLTVLAKIRAKDPEIYKADKPLFQDEDFEAEEQAKEKQKSNGKHKYTYKDMERQRILKNVNDNSKEGEEEEMDQQEEEAEPTPFELQKKLKKDFQKSAFATDTNNDDDLFKVKKSAPKAVHIQSDDHKLRKLAKDKTQEEILERFWGDDTKLNETDLFLKRYILNKGWIDTEGPEKKRLKKKVDMEDEERSQEMEQFEEKFNHRFEEPDGAHLQTFPRRIDESHRQNRQSRKEKRARKEQQKKQKLNEELRQAQKLKSQKKKQISERIAQIQRQKGLQNIQIEEQQHYENDNDEDRVWFYCDDCERGLNEDQAYYCCPQTQCQGYSLCKECYQLIIHKHQLYQSIVPEGCGAPDEEQVRRTLSSLLKCKKCKHSIGQYEKRYELTDPESNFKYNYCEECQDLLPLSLRKRCKQIKQQKIKLNEVLEKDPQKLKDFVEDDEVSRLLKEYEGLDFNQVIGDGIKTKFKYIDVKPESYGLSDEQLLLSDDRELNKYVSIKKLAPYFEENMRLRNSVYKNKIKSISRSARLNKKRVEAPQDPEYGVNRLKLLRKKAERRKKNAERVMKQTNKLRITDLSTKEAELKHFVSKSRLESYGITE